MATKRMNVISWPVDGLTPTKFRRVKITDRQSVQASGNLQYRCRSKIRKYLFPNSDNMNMLFLIKKMITVE